jgi:DNA-binding MarR family transcriptional regulator
MPISPRRTPTRTQVAGAAGSEALRVMDNLRRVVRALSASARGVSARGGVSGAQLFVLRQIDAVPSASLREVAERTLARQSTVSEVVSRLIERGFVVRTASAADARRAELSLTARGRRAIAGTEPTAQERLATGLAALPRARRVAIADGLDAWLVAAGLADVDPAMFFEPKQTETAGRRAHSARRVARGS